MSGSFQSFLLDILEEGRTTLAISRVSVWLFDDIENPTQLLNVANTDWPLESTATSLPKLNYEQFPSYFNAINSGETIAAHNAMSDPRTVEFRDAYLVPEGIVTMLDAVIFKNGIPHGVLCCEGNASIRSWHKDEVAYAEMIADCCSRRLLVHELWLAQTTLAEMAYKDPLTGLKNRRYLMENAQKEMSRHNRLSQQLSMIMVDLDHFKLINDKHGHDVGDIVLQSFSELCVSALRLEDCMCRLGGEEFIVLLPNTQLGDAMLIAERLRARIEKNTICFNELKINLTASFGVVEVNQNLPFGSSLKTADHAVYTAKASGRNCVVTL
ncbi:sensor domain-containing diguanylate cyclase [Pseudoalteromonas sp. T1lg65]|uniref:sensor domain-containing diguanylate cyclase n=1 Tax=Pseudoalteromonas sp. T1lg65 TaxID=2077101 RepID=UPI003F7A7F3D